MRKSRQCHKEGSAQFETQVLVGVLKKHNPAGGSSKPGMAQEGGTLQNYNNELVQCIEEV